MRELRQCVAARGGIDERLIASKKDYDRNLEISKQ